MGVILYAEDDENDAFLVQHAFAQAAITQRLIVVPDGRFAIDYLASQGAYADREQYPLPRLVLLDLKMPGVSGLEVLQWMRRTPQVSTLVAVMLTSSNQEADIRRAYAAGANGYLVKPGRIEDIITMARAVKDYWLTHNRVCFGPPADRESGPTGRI